MRSRGGNGMTYIMTAGDSQPRQQKLGCRRAQVLALAAVLFAVSNLHSKSSAAPLDDAAERYRPYLVEGIGNALKGEQALQERVAANDLEGARRGWLLARAGWGSSEGFTRGVVP